MRSIVSLVGSLAIALSAQAADLAFPADVAQWQSVAVPAESDRGARMAWFYAADYSRTEWSVLVDHDVVQARLDGPRHELSEPGPPFDAHAGKFRGASSFWRVDDGWLVGFNHGEWGGALYWFSSDGKRNYKISDHQIVRFFRVADKLHAIEGLAHLSLDEGSVIRISRAAPRRRWRAETFAKLSSAPSAVSVRADDTMLVTLSTALVSIDRRGTIETLLADQPWAGLYPNSSVISPDGQKLYIGMRQYVGEIDLHTATLRLLIPSAEFLNKLPAEDERRIREQFDNQGAGIRPSPVQESSPG